MNTEHILKLNPIIHAPIRLAVMSILISVENANFTYLKETIQTTDGNISTHLTKLEEAGYLKIKKTFKGKKPQTICSLTEEGREAFKTYIENLEKIINIQK